MTRVQIQTSLGDFVLELDSLRAPKSSANFLDYVNSGHYDGTIFHRVIDNFVIQGGNFKPGMVKQTTNRAIDNEAKNGLKNDKYTITMARTAAPHSASDQFFINVKDNDFLNYPGQDGWGYAVFGKVVKGTDVIDKIAKVRTTRSGMHANVPTEDVVILSAKVLPDAPELADSDSDAKTETDQNPAPVSKLTDDLGASGRAVEVNPEDGNEDDELPEMANDFVDELISVFSYTNYLKTVDLSQYGEQVVEAQRKAQEANRNLYLLLNDKVAELKQSE